ncbi:MAG: hypothetical protein J6A73_00780 [Lachnospiraceae bacterium]|nr:hypothetical protein [Lachnospiraceae bacterium]
MGMLKIGFDLDGVILNNTYFKTQKLKEIYGIELEEWKLNSNLIDDYITNVDIRHHLGRLAGTSTNDQFVDADCVDCFQRLIDAGCELYLVSRRGKSDLGVINANKSIENLDIKKFFKGCFFCETEEMKLNTIKELNLHCFFDDRIEVINGLDGAIPMPVLFDPFYVVERSLLNINCNCEISNCFKEIAVKIVSDAANIVFCLSIGKKKFYIKFYVDDIKRQKDNELLLYHWIESSEHNFFKRLLFEEKIGKSYAVFEEVEGILLADLLSKHALQEVVAERVVDAFVELINTLHHLNTIGYGSINENREGGFVSFSDFFRAYITPTLEALNTCDEMKKWVCIANKICNESINFLGAGNNGVVPMDNNFRNIMVSDTRVVFIDPGAVLSAPIEMGYGEFVAHAYGTILYPILIEKLGVDREVEKKIRTFSIFSLLNIMAFLVRNGCSNPDEKCPYGNDKTFSQLLEEHLTFVQSI